jgi:hypothetical protein
LWFDHLKNCLLHRISFFAYFSTLIKYIIENNTSTVQILLLFKCQRTANHSCCLTPLTWYHLPSVYECMFRVIKRTLAYEAYAIVYYLSIITLTLHLMLHLQTAPSHFHFLLYCSKKVKFVYYRNQLSVFSGSWKDSQKPVETFMFYDVTVKQCSVELVWWQKIFRT